MVLADLRAAIGATPGVGGVHDLHVWVSGADQPVCTAHVELAPDVDAEAVRIAVIARLKADFGLRHVTIQTEAEICKDGEGLHA